MTVTVRALDAVSLAGFAFATAPDPTLYTISLTCAILNSTFTYAHDATHATILAKEISGGGYARAQWLSWYPASGVGKESRLTANFTFPALITSSVARYLYLFITRAYPADYGWPVYTDPQFIIDLGATQNWVNEAVSLNGTLVSWTGV